MTTDVAAHSSGRIMSCYRLWSTIKNSAPRTMIAALQFPHLRTHAEYLSFKPCGKRKHNTCVLQALWMLIDFSATWGRGTFRRKKKKIGWIRIKPRHTTHQIKAFSRSKYTWISFQASVGNVNIHERHRWYLVRNRHSPVINPTVLSEILRPQFWSLKTIWPI